jgi:esterase/lipase superfamily enzyme
MATSARNAFSCGFLLTALVLGCAKAPSPPAPSTPAPASPPEPPLVVRTAPKADGGDRNYAVVRTFYATDRRRTADASPREMYGSERGELSYGTVDVSIPRKHTPGELESPSIWRMEFREDPERHVVLLAVDALPKDAYFTELARSVAAAKRPSAFVFVHGYHTTFENAARRTAQISYDVSFDGVPVFYSWPSHGSAAAYVRDEETNQLTVPSLRRFLEDFFDRSAAQDVYLVAHSMGNRALAAAVGQLVESRPQVRARLKEVILSAPDINVEIFKEQIYPALAKAGTPITLYASSQDVALAASKEFHGYARLGDSRPEPLRLRGMETIDATGVDVSFVAHSYFAETSPVLADIRALIRNGMRAAERTGLSTVKTGPLPYWVFKRPGN